MFLEGEKAKDAMIPLGIWGRVFGFEYNGKSQVHHLT